MELIRRFVIKLVISFFQIELGFYALIFLVVFFSFIVELQEVQKQVEFSFFSCEIENLFEANNLIGILTN